MLLESNQQGWDGAKRKGKHEGVLGGKHMTRT